MKRQLSKIILILLLILMLAPNLAMASDSDNSMIGRMKAAANLGGYNTEGDDTKLAEIVGTIISAFLSLLGVIFIVLILLAGFHWMMAQGAEDKINHAKDELKTATIGLVITLAAYGIWNFVWHFIIGYSSG